MHRPVLRWVGLLIPIFKEDNTMETMERAYELAQEHGMTMHQLSELCGIPYSTVRSNKSRNGQLSVYTIEKICQGLKIPLKDFFPEE